ncbi:hypothetical protein SNOG_12128 [Parastagonospora nodorum SN15]|uniref:Heterokaryon incompatibility domain-containing protein n=1 Tax=Phaeosphaeria nodorum (strain SN15 / ATCC MYA-4574 / FGSC 10173) TaxID=321614 RepID=Q0U7Y6_PHANO|nr:hypothetical protein SNOG_12128 [Parastagonospora nodorum SN15]EAT80540.1 hypothetical protein SNOG_12128 [Parastagonospora nodorum SN15]
MVGIPVSELPKTFSDAIDISRVLGIQYLWIDSLCIIQDDQADWEKHVEIMASIYESSYLTLAAGASSDDDGGFFSLPSGSYAKSQCSSLKLGGKLCNIYVRHISEYATRELTYPNDKLPALAGLANYFQRTFKIGPYVHGLWVSSLKEDLSWSIWGHSASIGRPRESPSWSWVSCVESKLDWTDFYESDFFHLCEIVKRPEKPMFAALSVSGILLTLSIHTRPKESELEERLSWVRRCQILKSGEYSDLKSCDTVVFESSHSAHPDDFEDRGVNKVGPGPLQSLTADFRADYRFWSSGEDLRVMLQHMVFCVLGIENRGRLDDVEPCWVAGMILRPIEDQGCFPEGSELQQFERIGWLRYCTDVMRSEFEPTGTKSHFLIV